MESRCGSLCMTISAPIRPQDQSECKGLFTRAILCLAIDILEYVFK